MIRRFNYTGRCRIPRSRIRIRVAETESRRRFDAEIALEGLGIPDEAMLFVEAYHRSAYRRFDFGTVGAPRPPANRWLDGIPVSKPLFRVKAVLAEDGLGRIVAAADKVVPQDSDLAEDDRFSLLPVEYEDLGDRIWALDLDSDSDWPRLLLNKNIPGIREPARSGPEFLSLVYPEVFRAVLAKLIEMDRFDPDCDDEDWGTMWLRFACRELGCPRPPQEGEGDILEWIDNAVNAFCVRAKVTTHFRRLLADRID